MSEAINVNKNFTLKRLDELKDMTFLVEAYQRGYKWDVQQVLDLLNDIDEFEAVGSRFYCLQPVVVKKINADDPRIIKSCVIDKDNVFELIDGQQRLTTVFIILSLLDKEQLPFNLIYKTRPHSEIFLNNIVTLQPISFALNTESIPETNRQLNNLWKIYARQNPAMDNVDNYHFFKVCQLILQWSLAKDNSSFIDKLLHKVKIIWYNIDRVLLAEEANVVTKNAEKIFIDFNQGKIPLDQAELIKALFVIKFKEIINLEIRSIHINQFAEEWNKIESQMQDDRFWYFVSNDTSDKKRYNRIDLLFDILSNKPQKTEDNLFAYHFNLKSNNSIDQTIENWKKLKDLFELLKEWYDDRFLYHLIGIIIYLDIKSTSELVAIYKNQKIVKNKTDFEHLLKLMITNELKKPEYEIAKLDYKSPVETKTVLHLFNISTYHISDFNYRFPFDKLKNQIWSLEHIHAQKADKFTGKQEFIEWLTDMLSLLIDINDQPKIEECKKLLDALNAHELEQVKRQLLDFNDALRNVLNMDNISNLCLLDTKTNSSLGNNIFKRKRQMILDVDRAGEVELEGEKHKVFVPISTKNVFLKYYAIDSSTIQFTYWGKQDREDYLSGIEGQLENFLSLT